MRSELAFQVVAAVGFLAAGALWLLVAVRTPDWSSPAGRGRLRRFVPWIGAAMLVGLIGTVGWVFG